MAAIFTIVHHFLIFFVANMLFWKKGTNFGALPQNARFGSVWHPNVDKHIYDCGVNGARNWYSTTVEIKLFWIKVFVSFFYVSFWSGLNIATFNTSMYKDNNDWYDVLGPLSAFEALCFHFESLTLTFLSVSLPSRKKNIRVSLTYSADFFVLIMLSWINKNRHTAEPSRGCTDSTIFVDGACYSACSSASCVYAELVVSSMSCRTYGGVFSACLSWMFIPLIMPHIFTCREIRWVTL